MGERVPEYGRPCWVRRVAGSYRLVNTPWTVVRVPIGLWGIYHNGGFRIYETTLQAAKAYVNTCVSP